MVAWGPAAIWAAFLFLLSSNSTLPVDLSSGLDKVAHFGAYLVLGFLVALGADRLDLPLALAIVLGAGYGVLDEFHQSMVPGRTATVGDWLADLAGVAVGVLLYRLIAVAPEERSGARV